MNPPLPAPCTGLLKPDWANELLATTKMGGRLSNHLVPRVSPGNEVWSESVRRRCVGSFRGTECNFTSDHITMIAAFLEADTAAV